MLPRYYWQAVGRSRSRSGARSVGGLRGLLQLQLQL